MEVLASLGYGATLFVLAFFHDFPQSLVRELDVDFALADTNRLNRPAPELPRGVELHLLSFRHITLQLTNDTPEDGSHISNLPAATPPMHGRSLRSTPPRNSGTFPAVQSATR